MPNLWRTMVTRMAGDRERECQKAVVMLEFITDTEIYERLMREGIAGAKYKMDYC